MYLPMNISKEKDLVYNAVGITYFTTVINLFSPKGIFWKHLPINRHTLKNFINM